MSKEGGGSDGDLPAREVACVGYRRDVAMQRLYVTQCHYCIHAKVEIMVWKTADSAALS